MSDILTRRPLRSALTILATAIGAGSVIAVLGIGAMTTQAIQSSLRTLASPGALITPDADQDDPDAARLRYADAAAIKDGHADAFAQALPLYQRSSLVTAEGAQAIAVTTSAGAETFSAEDIASARHVCRLSASLARRLFGENDPVGAEVRIDRKRFHVIAVQAAGPSGVLNGAGSADSVDIPFTTSHADMPGPIDAIRVVAAPGFPQDRADALALASLRRLHGKHAAYVIQDTRALAERFSQASRLVTDGIAVLDGIALPIAGVGIMNVMLASVHERTREIGVRKAIGADNAAIFRQFLMESLILSSLGCAGGGVVGFIAAAAARAPIERALGATTIPWTPLITCTLLFALLIGIGFGLFPALRAREIEPMRALRA